MSPGEKSDFANAQHADAFISVHVNSAPESEQGNRSGFEIGISKKNLKFLNKNQVLGSAILQNISSNFKAERVLEQKRVGIWVLDNCNMPAALIECGYITNADDANNLKDDEKIELMAKNILQGVAAFVNNKVDNSSLYQIQKEAANTSAPVQSMKRDTAQPIYVLDGKIVDKSVVDKTAPSSYESVNVLKGTSATDKYGDKGKNGVVEITSKKGVPPPPPPPPEEPKTPPNPPTVDTTAQTKPVFNQIKQEAKFPGGAKGWLSYLQNNLEADVPAKNNAPAGMYTVTVSFLVDANGKVSEVKAIKDPGYGTAAEAERVIAKGPNWIPAIQDGHKVTYRQKQNITFQLTKMN